MISILSLVTSVKDYVEVVHKLIESDSNFGRGPAGAPTAITNYEDLGPIITYTIITLKELILNVISFKWLRSLWDLPIIIPNISSAMISEISVLDGYIHNAFNFLDTPLSYGETNSAVSSLEKFSIGLINSLFLFIPTGTAHLITLRRFVIQGLEAGYLSGLGSICGNILWITSILFGCRFFVIPWLSLDIFRYILGFVILVKYMWDSYNERKMVITTVPAKQKIFLLNFLLALTEQTSIYPFISNMSIGPESSILESFPAQNFSEFLVIHGCYILGLTLGCLSLLQLTCWFWENPAFKIYMWAVGSFKVSTSFYYKVLNFTFLYLTMICAISSIPYYGLDYALTNPLGFVQDDRILDQKFINASGFSFLNTKASDRNTRRNRGRHGRRERWKRRIRKYRTFDASLYDQGVYDIFTIEDLNYGFDRFWLRRKMRNHTVRFRFFPGPWMRSFKKQLAKPRLESYAGPRQEFFRILFEQVYHPSFHEYSTPPPLGGGAGLPTGLPTLWGLWGPKENRGEGGSPPSTLNNSPSFQIPPQGGGIPGSPPLGGGYDLRSGAKGPKKGGAILNKKNVSNLALIDKPLYLLPKLGPPGGRLPPPRGGGGPLKKELSIYSNNIGALTPPLSVGEGGVPRGAIRGTITSGSSNIKQNLKIENSTLRKFVRKINTRIKSLEIKNHRPPTESGRPGSPLEKYKTNMLYSKRWKQIFSKMDAGGGAGGPPPPHGYSKELTINNGALKGLLKNFYQNSLIDNESKRIGAQLNFSSKKSLKKENSRINLSKKDQQILKYRSIFFMAEGTPTPRGAPHSVGATGGHRQEKNTLSDGSIHGSPPPRGPGGGGFPPFLKGANFLHPLKFYLKKQQAFERKLRYYTPTIFRKFSIENNAPYFRIMMKRYFYYFKPTLRWERTMKVASFRKARRKTSSPSRKIQFTDNSLRSLSPSNQSELALINTESQQEVIQSNSNLIWQTRAPRGEAPPPQRGGGALENRIVKPTHNYTIVGKRASRYRYQIYKDVLQHWYYSPFNRLLLKFDIDLFIKRQPKSHFIGKNEATLLSLRRSLLTEHYNTLRWYTYMQHYRSMKTKIGGTKTVASTAYNQQFAGTFKKIRHLFAITPSQSNETVLKFDQPLYNEYYNNSNQNYQNNFLIHEELLTSPPIIQPKYPTAPPGGSPPLWGGGSPLSGGYGGVKVGGSGAPDSNLGDDLLNQSNQIIRNYLIKSDPIKKEYINSLIEQKNYDELTKFLYKGLKTRGERPVINQKTFLSQEKEYLFTNIEIENLKNLVKLRIDNYFHLFKVDIFPYLKKYYKRMLCKPESVKNYLKRKLEKYQKRRIKIQKNFNIKLQRLLNINNPPPFLKKPPQAPRGGGSPPVAENPGSFRIQKNASPPPEGGGASVSTGLQKALVEGISSIEGVESKLKTQTVEKYLKKMSQFKKEKQLNSSLNNLSKIVNGLPSSSTPHVAPTEWGARLKPLNLKAASAQMKNFYKKFNFDKIRFIRIKFINIFKLSKSKNKTIIKKPIINYWLQKERVLNKQKRIRKEFKQFIKRSFKNMNFQPEIDKLMPDSSDPSQTYTKAMAKLNLLPPGSPGLPPPIKKGGLRAYKNGGGYEEFASASGAGYSQKRDYSQVASPDSNLYPTSAREDSRNKSNSFFAPPPSNYGGSLANVSPKNKNSWSLAIKNIYTQYFTKKLKRKKSPQRRSRVRKNRGIVKKQTLSDSLKRELKNKRKYSFSTENDNVAAGNQQESSRNTGASHFYLSINKELNGVGHLNQNFERVPLQRRSKQKKQRFWKEKRSKFSQNLRKYKKRRRSVLSKVRILNKQLKRIKATTDLKNWWWANFLPNFRATINSLLQKEVDGYIVKKLQGLSVSEILERDKFASNILQVGNYDYKPLALPETTKMVDKYGEGPVGASIVKTNQTSIQNQPPPLFKKTPPGPQGGGEPPQNNILYEKEVLALQDTPIKRATPPYTPRAPHSVGASGGWKGGGEDGGANDIISNVIKTTLLGAPPPLGGGAENEIGVTGGAISPLDTHGGGGGGPPENLITNPIPFYAGWDESLRKFVVTNRLLSRRESGNEMILQQEYQKDFKSLLNQEPSQNRLSFTAAPLKGMNAATTLYWQIPFTTYDPDQFFALGMDGFAPLGWRRFQFRHSILKSWLYEKTTLANPNLGSLQNTINPLNTYIVKTKANILQSKQSVINNKFVKGVRGETPRPKMADANKNIKNINRRVKKRYRRVKKHPRSPVWFPSGPLLNQVLPVHYIYIFYKRSRLPRDRYIKRRLRKSKEAIQNKKNKISSENSISTPLPPFSSPPLRGGIGWGGLTQAQVPDFTLRKRIKTKRKYHIKQNLNKKSPIIPRRMIFTGEDPLLLRWRPLSKQKLNKPIAEFIKEQRALRSKQRRKDLLDGSNKQTPNIRVKQLRRRVQRQIIRSVWRYKPRAGGFIWPGDYLKLELQKAPKLKTNDKTYSAAISDSSKISPTTIKVKRKKKRSIQDWQIQTKKYLLQKHNNNVIKKKLEKANRSNKIKDRIKELSFAISI